MLHGALIGKLLSIPIASKVSKAPTTSCTYSSLPKSAKSHFGCLKPLGVKNNLSEIIFHEDVRSYHEELSKSKSYLKSTVSPFKP
jgi:hypothetical protein